MMFPSIECKVDTSFQPSLLNNIESLDQTQLKTGVIDSRRVFDTPLPISTENTEQNIYLELDLPNWYITTVYFLQ